MRHHWFEDLADHLGEAYLRYSFTRGTASEVRFITGAAGLSPGDRVLDVGCGPGRHAHALAALGLHVVGVDISERFCGIAASGPGGGTGARPSVEEPAGSASFVRGDARALPVAGRFDAVVSLCQGGFGLLGLDADGGGDGSALAQMAAALRPGGVLVASAFSAYFQVRWLEDGDTFDAERGVNHERTTIRSPGGDDVEADLWTTCFTPRELTMMAVAAGLEVVAIHGVTPGDYEQRPPSLERPELLLVARRPEVPVDPLTQKG